MVFEYSPWKRAGRQPLIGVVAFVGCTILGAAWIFVAATVGYFVTLPVFQALFPSLTPTADETAVAVALWSITYAEWLIVAVIVVALFFDNWPKGYSQRLNFFIRLFVVCLLGTVFFFGFYYVAPYLGFAGNPFTDRVTSFIVLLLWIQLVFAYLWRKWPVYTAME